MILRRTQKRGRQPCHSTCFPIQSSSRAFVKTRKTTPTSWGSSMKIILALLLAAAPLAAQSFDPHDLQGTWTGATITAFERPPEFAGKEFLTDKEVKEFES